MQLIIISNTQRALPLEDQSPQEKRRREQKSGNYTKGTKKEHEKTLSDKAMSNSSGNGNSKPMSFTLGTKRPNAQVKALFADDGDDDVQQQSQPKTQSQTQAQAQIQVSTPQQSILQDAKKSQDERDLSSSAPKEKRSRWGQAVVEDNSPSGGPQTTPQPPIDPEIVKVIEKTAEYVSRAGPSLEAVIRTKQQENPQFRFLFDESLPEAFFYRSKLQQLTSQQQISSPNSTVSSVESGSPASRTMPSGRVSKFSSVPIDRELQPPGYTPTPMQTAKPQTYVPPPALPASSNVGASETFKEEDEEDEGSDEEAQLAKYQRILEAYKRQQPPPKKQETPDEDGVKHHIGDFIPKEELEKFYSKAAQVTGRKISAFASQQTPVQTPTLGEENVGHKLMAKMGWQQGQKLGINGNGLEKPIEAAARDQPLGIGAHAVGDIQPEDDEFEIYRKRMMLSYRYRPNPLGNPRKQYY